MTLETAIKMARMGHTLEHPSIPGKKLTSLRQQKLGEDEPTALAWISDSPMGNTCILIWTDKFYKLVESNELDSKELKTGWKIFKKELHGTL